MLGWPGPLTRRQWLAWQAWLHQQWNRPDRSDHYAMQIAYEVRRNNAKEPNRVKMDHCRLRFRDGKEELSVAQATFYSQAKWFAAVGMPPPKPPNGQTNTSD